MDSVGDFSRRDVPLEHAVRRSPDCSTRFNIQPRDKGYCLSICGVRKQMNAAYTEVMVCAKTYAIRPNH